MNWSKVYQRAKNMLYQPEQEWVIIKEENLSQRTVLREYAWPMMLIVLVSTFIGSMLFHTGYHLTFGYLFARIITSLVLSGGVMYLSAFFINEAVEGSGGIKNMDAAMGLTTYSWTAFFLFYALASILSLFPLNVLFYLCGLYSVYLYYTGISPMLSVPENNKTRFTIISVIIMLVLYTIASVILGILFAGLLESEVTITL
ncbi:MAG TPA: Yip1 family protein [Bacteroidales bacterium]|nr:Yip1 family protein [Bacteroidales bacterium]HQK37102.1 Yip1 family protein [Bacteroidales bacterium]